MAKNGTNGPDASSASSAASEAASYGVTGRPTGPMSSSAARNPALRSTAPSVRSRSSGRGGEVIRSKPARRSDLRSPRLWSGVPTRSKVRLVLVRVDVLAFASRTEYTRRHEAAGVLAWASPMGDAERGRRRVQRLHGLRQGRRSWWRCERHPRRAEHALLGSPRRHALTSARCDARFAQRVAEACPRPPANHRGANAAAGPNRSRASGFAGSTRDGCLLSRFAASSIRCQWGVESSGRHRQTDRVCLGKDRICLGIANCDHGFASLNEVRSVARP